MHCDYMQQINLSKHELQIHQMIDVFADKLKHDSKPANAWKIKVDGEFIVTRSKKSVWKAKNHASSALRLHFSALTDYRGDLYKYRDTIKVDYREFERMFEERYQAFLKERVEFVQLA